MLLYHGSNVIVEKPMYGSGRPHNDYGQGFYCTKDVELANEWACSGISGGFTNAYELDSDHLSTLILDEHNIIAWLTLLIRNRVVRYSSPIEKQGAEYLIKHFLPDISGYDLIEGYRADDSYFTYARAFLTNTISIEQLSAAMKLGKLGKQICLKSRNSFDAICFREARAVDGSIYYPKRMEREKQARNDYYHLLEKIDMNGIFIRDIMRKEMTIDELRIS